MLDTKNFYFGPPRFRTAIQAVLWLAKSNSVISSSFLATNVRTHSTFVRRIMTALSKADIIISKNGRNGGYYLEKSPADITLSDIYHAIALDSDPLNEDPFLDTDVCAPQDSELQERQERLNIEQFNGTLDTVLSNAESNAIHYLETITIEDLMHEVTLIQ